ncbi:PIN domain-containing protein [Antribacter gilvus]|uniref:PIN domain-containing protein n=1 Tax=Antribacter gilvus TaxID=2304675 RepID=UPI000F791771|nr:PIN domain-containing protein [Antribacter gilvus]
MSASGSDARIVILDTDVWSHIFVRKQKSDETEKWREALTGRTVVIATQTRAEVLYGLLSSNWGESRRAVVQDVLDRTATVPVTNDVVVAYANLASDSRRGGHGLASKVHTGDRWVAATAIALGAPLLAADKIYRGAPGLDLLSLS